MTEIEIHDSRVGKVAQESSHIEIHFEPSMVHVSDGKPGVDSCKVYKQDFCLIFQDASIEGTLPSDYPAWCVDGFLDLNGEKLDNMIPVPLAVKGRIVLELTFNTSETFRALGSAVDLEPRGPRTYLEEFR